MGGVFLETTVGDSQLLLDLKKFLGLQIHERRLPNILQHNLFIASERIGLAYGCEGQNLSLAYFFKILEYNFFVVFAHHPDHLLHFLQSMWLIHAAEEERDLFRGDLAIVI